MLRRLTLRDVVIVAELAIDLAPGFSVLTGETGAGKSILIDALQLALGNRADSALVREGATRAEVSAEFDTPPSLQPWLIEAGFDADETLLLRRTIDLQGKSRAWINGSPSTVTQLREAAEHLVDIHGQHAWQGLTRPATVRALLDTQAGADPAPTAAAWRAWRDACTALATAQSQSESADRERERLAWQIAELDKLAPEADEWDRLNGEHQRLANGQALLDNARAALAAVADDDTSAALLCTRAIGALDEVQRFDAALAPVAEALRGAQTQIEDAAHTLRAYLAHAEPDPGRLAELDDRIGAWVSLARRHRRRPADLPSLLDAWKQELAVLDAAADLEGLQDAVTSTRAGWQRLATQLSAQRKAAAPRLAVSVTQAMQQLGMSGGSFEVALLAQDEPQPFGLETVELRVAGHAGSTPRALSKVASGGELSRLALAIAVTTAVPAATKAAARCNGPGAGPGTDSASSERVGTAGVPTLIFDEIDAGVGGAVADSVGRLMKQLGRSCQVLAVTHLAQVAACADGHFVVSKALQGSRTLSQVVPVDGETRVAEVARMLGGERLSGTAHAQALLGFQPERGLQK